MINELLVAPLLRVRLFQGLSAYQLGEIARHAERIVYRDGAVICEEGDDADAAILIVAGDSERVSAGVRERVETGSLIAEMAMLIEHSYGSTVIARGPVRALRLPRAAMHALMSEDPPLAAHMVERISSRLSVMLDDLRAVDQTLAAEQVRHGTAIAPLARQDAPYSSQVMH